MTHLTEQLELLFDAYKIVDTPNEARINELCLDGLLTLREKQQTVRNLLVEDSLFRKALMGDVRACLTWLSFRAPQEWNAKHLSPAASSFSVSDHIDFLLQNPVPDREHLDLT